MKINNKIAQLADDLSKSTRRNGNSMSDHFRSCLVRLMLDAQQQQLLSNSNSED